MDLSPSRLRRVLRQVDHVSRSWSLTRQAAVAVVLRYSGPLPDVLLMRRIERRGDPWSGQVSLPGGRAQSQDADLCATATRETREEVELDLDRCGQYLGALPPTHPLLTGPRRPLRVTPLVFQLVRPVQPRPGTEARRVFWLPLARALMGDLDSTYTFHLGPLAKDFPCWRYEGEVIWGLTYRILGTVLSC